MNRLTLLTLLALILIPHIASADPVSAQFNDRQINANFVSQDNVDYTSPVFLILHGTWATYNQELVATLQELLADSDVPSLAPTLSLNQNNRTLFQSCDQTMTAGHADNLDEIEFWLDWLAKKGFENIHVIAHSRGGAMMALYTQATDRVQSQTLIAPMVFSFDEQKLGLLDSKNDEDILTDVKFLYCDSGSITVAAYRSYYDKVPEKHTPKLLLSTPLPTYIFLGSDDPLTEPFLADFDLSLLPEGSSMDIIDGSDHFFRDLYADEVVELLLEKFE